MRAGFRRGLRSAWLAFCPALFAVSPAAYASEPVWPTIQQMLAERGLDHARAIPLTGTAAAVGGAFAVDLRRERKSVPGLGAFDFDGTVGQNLNRATVEEYLAQRPHRRAHRIEDNDYLVLRQIWNEFQDRGYIARPDPATVIQRLFGAFRGRPPGDMFELTVGLYLSEHAPGFHGEALELMREHKRGGNAIALISNSGLPSILAVAGGLGLVDFVVASIPGVRQGKLTGENAYVANGQAKRAATEVLCRQLGVTPGSGMAVGDTKHDLPMLKGMRLACVTGPEAAGLREQLERGDYKGEIRQLKRAHIVSAERFRERFQALSRLAGSHQHRLVADSRAAR